MIGPDTTIVVPSATGLPVEGSRDAIESALATGTVIIRAEPGAGKSSLVPLIVAASLPTDARVIVTEPRRLAARATAQRLADLTRTRLGTTVGVTVRGERRVGARTRIEVVTEAVLTNRLQRDPELRGVGAVVFDEFHERNLHSDLGLAMTIEARSALRDDLIVVIMSATLEVERLADLLGGPPVVDVAGRTFPVVTEHRRRPEARRWTAELVDAIESSLASVTGDVLVFVPGRREIDDVLAESDRRRLGEHAELLGLHGSTPVGEQRSITTGSQRRRVIVATSVAETSITVPGVEAVVDGGRLRRGVFDPSSGLGRLETGSVTIHSADQRRGRAGRVAPGRCIRMWSSDEHRHLDVSAPPAIVGGDPLPVAFELARWSDPWGEDLILLDHPGLTRLEAAQRILRLLGLTDTTGRLTTDGAAAARLGLHPRLAALVLTARRLDLTGLGLRAAALLDDDQWPHHADLVAELEVRWSELRQPAARLARRLDVSEVAQPRDLDDLGSLLAAAWPDRIAMARPDRPGRFLLAIGREVEIPEHHPLAGSPFLVVADADGVPRSARIRRAVSLGRTELLSAAASHIEWRDHVEWDHRDDTLRAERQQRIAGLVLHRDPLARPTPDALAAALRAGLRRSGLAVLRWGPSDEALRDRLAWLRSEAPDSWPDVSDASLLDRLDDWLDIDRCRSVADLRRAGRANALLTLLDWEQHRSLDTDAPASLEPPRGRAQPIRYDSGRPVWSVRIQHLFGLDRHPLVGPHRTPVTIELLSPANRPAQITTDLPGFWRGSYSAVRSDLRGRYPKHSWPEDPLA